MSLQPAAALSLLDPFNVPGTLDGGVAEVAKDAAYGQDARHKLDVYAPEALEAGAPAPVVVFIYGGAWKQGTKADYVYLGRALASRGFVTVIPDYRLVPETRYPGFLDDNARAINWVQDNILPLGGDPNRIFLAGHSAGAYNAVMLGMDRSYLRDAGAVVPIRAVAGISGPYSVYPFEFAELQEAFAGVDNPQLTQPINMPIEEAPPMLLMTGDSDLIVSSRNTRLFAQRLLDGGQAVVEKTYEGLGHMEPVMAISTVWRWRAPVLDDMVAFFEDQGAFNPEAFGPLDLVAPVDGTVETAVDAAEAVAGEVPLPEASIPEEAAN
jgi:acetyl esterase/lipase